MRRSAVCHSCTSTSAPRLHICGLFAGEGAVMQSAGSSWPWGCHGTSSSSVAAWKRSLLTRHHMEGGSRRDQNLVAVVTALSLMLCPRGLHRQSTAHSGFQCMVLCLLHHLPEPTKCKPASHPKQGPKHRVGVLHRLHVWMRHSCERGELWRHGLPVQPDECPLVAHLIAVVRG